MYNVARNNFYRREKNATVYTPAAVSEFLFALVRDRIAPDALVFDPCVGAGSLLQPFRRAGFRTFGMDIEHQGFEPTLAGAARADIPAAAGSLTGCLLYTSPSPRDS